MMRARRRRHAGKAEMVPELGCEHLPVVEIFPREREMIERARGRHQEKARAKRRPNAGAGKKTEISSLHGIDGREDGDARQGPECGAERRARGRRASFHQKRCQMASAPKASPKDQCRRQKRCEGPEFATRDETEERQSAKPRQGHRGFENGSLEQAVGNAPCQPIRRGGQKTREKNPGKAERRERQQYAVVHFRHLGTFRDRMGSRNGRLSEGALARGKIPAPPRRDHRLRPPLFRSNPAESQDRVSQRRAEEGQ